MEIANTRIGYVSLAQPAQAISRPNRSVSGA
jgi:hypothetical protein